jgi:hypothetical protein
MPDLIRHPELIEITGFRPQFIPHLMRGRNDIKWHFSTFCETVKIDFNKYRRTNLYFLALLVNFPAGNLKFPAEAFSFRLSAKTIKTRTWLTADHLPKMPALAKWVNSNFNQGFKSGTGSDPGTGKSSRGLFGEQALQL